MVKTELLRKIEETVFPPKFYFSQQTNNNKKYLRQI